MALSPGTAGPESFTRQAEQKDDAPTAAARALLQQVAKQYRTLPSYSEMVSTVTRGGTRQITRSKFYFLPPDKMRGEVEDQREPFVRVADGKQQWTIYPAANEYIVDPQPKNTQLNMALDPERGTPRITGHEPIDGAACTVIQVKLERGAVQMYWIEDERHVIRKETLDAGEAWQSEVSYPVVRLGGVFMPGLFTYDPAATNAMDRDLVSRSAPTALIGKPAGDFTLPDLSGREVTLRSLRGKVVLLDFWGSWCPPCRQALPGIEMLHRGLQANGLVVMGVDSEPPEKARQYVASLGYTFPTLVDTKETVVKAFHVQSWPTTIVIDREGRIVYYSSGNDPEKFRDLLRGLGVW